MKMFVYVVIAIAVIYFVVKKVRRKKTPIIYKQDLLEEVDQLPDEMSNNISDEEGIIEVRESVQKDPAIKVKDFVTIYVVAPMKRLFGGYDMLQAILATGLQYGDQQIFHYYQGKNRTGKKLFSVASADEPGEFDLSKIGNFSCSGLILYQKIADYQKPVTIFDLMLDVAYQLAEDLGGEVRLAKDYPWTEELSESIRQQLLKQTVIQQ
ncbi:MAG: cell division protein ZipA C-terminal FtsZ-binding domain-containing protein [Pseudomonadota bacterium]